MCLGRSLEYKLAEFCAHGGFGMIMSRFDQGDTATTGFNARVSVGMVLEFAADNSICAR